MKAVKPLTRRAAWKSLAAHSKQIKALHLRELFAEDARRSERFTAEAAGLFLDYSKNRLTETTLKLLVQLAKQSNLRAKMDAYERVLIDAMARDATSFAREDYAEEAWRIVDPVLKAGTPLHEYEPKTWGPTEVESLTPPGGGSNPVVTG
jgi:hypothetical protein